jgi:hyaluronoglucosaminidase
MDTTPLPDVDSGHTSLSLNAPLSEVDSRHPSLLAGQHLALLPRPKELSLTGTPLAIGSIRIVSGCTPDSEAWRLLSDLRPEDLPAEGYALRLHKGGAVIAAADAAGEFHGRATVKQLQQLAVGQNGQMTQLDIRDWPTLPSRGIMEGFYGAPWSHEDRLEMLRFAGRNKLNTYAYAPKDDPYHRAKWREPYPPDELSALGELVRVATANHVQFTYTLAPGLTMRYSDEAEYLALYAKAQQLWDAGVRSIALLFDDLDPELSDPEDRAMFGSEPGSAGAAHGIVCARFQREFLEPKGITEPATMVPRDYAGTSSTPYRRHLAATLPGDALVWWTGTDIVVGAITRDEIDAAAASYERELLLWDNFPVNDFDSARLFLGPLQGRATNLAGSRLRGISANPMVEAAASHLALASVADWAWNPQGYDAANAAERALYWVTGSSAPAIAPLIEACSSWPPSAPQHPRLSAFMTAALSGDPESLESVERELFALAALPDETEGTPGRLHEDLRPWIDAAGHAADAALLATELLRSVLGGESDDLAGLRGLVVAAQEIADTDVANVLRSVLPDYVKTVLELAGADLEIPDSDAAPASAG